MNIFVLDENPNVAAEYHCNNHVVKMILEAGQMLCTAHWVYWLEGLGKTRNDFRLMRDVKQFLKENVYKDNQPPWSMTHTNHPCSIWTRETQENYNWHLELMGALLREYRLRYKRKHKSEEVFWWLSRNQPQSYKSKGLTPFPICMKEEYKVDNDPIKSYRNYYIKDKVRFAKWEPHAKTPLWYKEMLNA